MNLEVRLIAVGLWKSGAPHPAWLLLGYLLEPLQSSILNPSSTQPPFMADLEGSGAPLLHELVSPWSSEGATGGTAGVRGRAIPALWLLTGQPCFTLKLCSCINNFTRNSLSPWNRLELEAQGAARQAQVSSFHVSANSCSQSKAEPLASPSPGLPGQSWSAGLRWSPNLAEPLL